MNPELTKSERHTAYIILLAEVMVLKRKREDAFVCHIIEYLMGYEYTNNLSFSFPEFYSKRPLTAGYAWWKGNDYESRIKALQQCIEETYDFKKEEGK